MSIAVVISIAALAVVFMALFFWKMCVEHRRGGLWRIVRLATDRMTLREEEVNTNVTQAKVIPMAVRSKAPNSSDVDEHRQFTNTRNAAHRIRK